MSSSYVLQPVVMAGGSGTRLWPLSRMGFPKQFLTLTGNTSLFQQSVQRLAALADSGSAVAPPLVVSNEEHRFLALEQLREMGGAPGALLLEPCARNTAPAVTLAALAAQQRGDDPVLVVTPADQTIGDEVAFAAAVQEAARRADRGDLVILGVPPDRAETGYGYIRCQGHSVQAFVEKPDRATAERYLAEGGYHWNAGLFVMKASTWLAALALFRPDILQATEAAFAGKSQDGPFVRPDAKGFAAVPADSVDYAVLERCPGSSVALSMVPLEAGWNDLGSWDAVWQVGTKDANDNVHSGDTLIRDCREVLIQSTSRLVVAVGMEGAMIIETPDAVLVVNKTRVQDVKCVVEQLQASGRGEQLFHRRVHRPWGWYDGIDHGDRFQVKHIQVKPGASLSLQMHHHRAEHWIVVRGTAEVTIGEETRLLTENQSTYIPLGTVHRLANPGKVPLELIEVQSGSYLGEDDIVRFSDSYGRT